MRVSTIGGNVAEYAGGLRALKYGVTRDYVLGVEAVLADGRGHPQRRAARQGRRRLRPAAPALRQRRHARGDDRADAPAGARARGGRRTGWRYFARARGRGRAVSRVLASRRPPRHPRVPRPGVHRRCVEDYAQIGLRHDCAARSAHGTRTAIRRRRRRAAAHGAIAQAQGALDVRSARRRGGERGRWRPRDEALLGPRAPASRPTILEDVTVPRSELADDGRIHRQTPADTDSRSAPSATWATATCIRPLLDGRADADEMSRVHHALDAIVARTLELGGTITGEHGVGLAKKAVAAASVGGRQLRAHAPDQADAGSGEAPQPGKIFD